MSLSPTEGSATATPRAAPCADDWEGAHACFVILGGGERHESTVFLSGLTDGSLGSAVNAALIDVRRLHPPSLQKAGRYCRVLAGSALFGSSHHVAEDTAAEVFALEPVRRHHLPRSSMADLPDHDTRRASLETQRQHLRTRRDSRCCSPRG